MIYGTSTSTFPDDGYGWNTDNPPTAYEIIDDALKVKDEEKIADDFREFVETEAHEFFNANSWGEEEWDAWKEKLMELI